MLSSLFIACVSAASTGSNQPSVNAECKIVSEAYELLGGSEEFGAPPATDCCKGPAALRHGITCDSKGHITKIDWSCDDQALERRSLPLQRRQLQPCAKNADCLPNTFCDNIVAGSGFCNKVCTALLPVCNAGQRCNEFPLEANYGKCDVPKCKTHDQCAPTVSLLKCSGQATGAVGTCVSHTCGVLGAACQPSETCETNKLLNTFGSCVPKPCLVDTECVTAAVTTHACSLGKCLPKCIFTAAVLADPLAVPPVIAAPEVDGCSVALCNPQTKSKCVNQPCTTDPFNPASNSCPISVGSPFVCESGFCRKKCNEVPRGDLFDCPGFKPVCNVNGVCSLKTCSADAFCATIPTDNLPMVCEGGLCVESCISGANACPAAKPVCTGGRCKATTCLNSVGCTDLNFPTCENGICVKGCSACDAVKTECNGAAGPLFGTCSAKLCGASFGQGDNACGALLPICVGGVCKPSCTAATCSGTFCDLTPSNIGFGKCVPIVVCPAAEGIRCNAGSATQNCVAGLCSAKVVPSPSAALPTPTEAPEPSSGSLTCPAFTLGSLSLNLAKLPKLQILILDNAQVITLDLLTINMFKKIKALQFLSLRAATDGSFAENLPVDAFCAPALTFLDIESNSFQGPLPGKFFTLAKLKFFRVAQNDFSGSLINPPKKQGFKKLAKKSVVTASGCDIISSGGNEQVCLTPPNVLPKNCEELPAC